MALAGWASRADHRPMAKQTIEDLLAEQAGVIARRQAIECGLTKTDIARLLRRREWVAVHEGVYVDHTGPLTWLQRAWAAVLFSWPAALSHDSALRAAEGPGRRDRDTGTIHVSVNGERHLVEPEGVRLHRVGGFSGRVSWNLGPPRVRYDEAVLDLAAEAPTDVEALARLAEACGSRRTTAQRLLKLAGKRKRLARRAWIEAVLGDIAEGTCSVLEHGYLARVERPHGLPSGRRQSAEVTEQGLVRRDVE